MIASMIFCLRTCRILVAKIQYVHSGISLLTVRSICTTRLDVTLLLLDGYGGWSSEGCITSNSTKPNDTDVICMCNHLTNFAILLVT